MQLGKEQTHLFFHTSYENGNQFLSCLSGPLEDSLQPKKRIPGHFRALKVALATLLVSLGTSNETMPVDFINLICCGCCNFSEEKLKQCTINNEDMVDSKTSGKFKRVGKI